MLSTDLVVKASGTFLWVVLVNRSFLEAFVISDSFTEL